MRFPRILLLGIAVGLAGCHTGTLPNPNDPKDVGFITVDNMKDQLGCISDALFSREAKGQIDDKTFHDLLALAAAKLLKGVDVARTDISKQYELAGVMMDAREYKDSKEHWEAAIRWAKANGKDDLWVNASLKLAQVHARLGDIPEAIKTARSVFGVQPSGAAPILYGTLYEITPVARGKGHDIELARMLEDAMIIDLHVYIDPQFQSGRDFLRARPAHLRRAWETVRELYRDAKRPDLEEEARKRLAIKGKEIDTSSTEVKV